MVKDVEDAYTRLITWLQTFEGFESRLGLRDVPGAGRGLFALSDAPPEQPLLVIPAPALLNPITLLASPSNPIPAHLFPVAKSAKPPRLNTTQLLTLYLALIRTDTSISSPVKEKGKGQADSGDARSDWAEYIDTLPKSFRPWHPLTWVVEPEEIEGSDGQTKADWAWWNALAETVPIDAKLKLAEVKDRWEADEICLRGILDSDPAFSSRPGPVTQSTLLWAWLIVNTRTVSLPLGLPHTTPDELNNHTLVPLLDMINHSSAAPSPSSRIPSSTSQTSSAPPDLHPSGMSTSRENDRPRPRQIPTPGYRPVKRPRFSGSRHLSNGDANNWHLVPGKVAFDLPSPSGGMREGAEALFEYGSHGNVGLWAEYGFVETPEGWEWGLPLTEMPKRESKGGGRKKEKPGDREMIHGRGWMKMKHAQVDLEPWVRQELEDADFGGSDKASRSEAFKAVGCPGNIRIHAQPRLTASHQLLMALRILALPQDSPKLAHVTSGQITYISPSNEKAALALLKQACERCVEIADEWTRRVETMATDLVVNKKEEERREKLAAVRGVVALLDERKCLCLDMLDRLAKGEEVE